MLDGIGYVNRLAVDADFRENFVEQASGRAHERQTRSIFFVARLFADKNHPRGRRARAKDSLRRPPVELAAPTVGSRLSQLL
jgi:hypothetical protein